MPIGVRLTGPTRKKFFRPTSRLALCSSQLNSACAQNYMGITHMTPEQRVCNNMLRIALLSSGLTEVVLSFFCGPPVGPVGPVRLRDGKTLSEDRCPRIPLRRPNSMCRAKQEQIREHEPQNQPQVPPKDFSKGI